MSLHQHNVFPIPLRYNSVSLGNFILLYGSLVTELLQQVQPSIVCINILQADLRYSELNFGQ